MGWARTGVAVVTALVLAACGGGDGGSDEPGEAGDATTTTEAADRRAGDGTGFRAEGTYELIGLETTVDAVVADLTTYSIEFQADDLVRQEVRVGQRVWVRSGPDVPTLDDRLWQELQAFEGTALGSLRQLSVAPPPPEQMRGFTATEVAADAFVEVALTAPHLLVDVDALDAVITELDPEVPDEIASALERLELDLPTLDLTVTLDAKELSELDLQVSSPGVELEISVDYTDHGRVLSSEVEPPSGDDVDPTPWLDEEELADFDDAPLVMPSAPPTGLLLYEVLVLDPGETPEGCRQVELYYDIPATAAPDERFLSLYLLPKTCAVDFDPTAFDETFGGLPSRYDGFEVAVGETVVQLYPSDALVPEMEAMVASLLPVDVATLIAAVE